MFELFAKGKSLFSVYTAGQAVIDAVFLKKAQLTANTLSVFLIAAVAALKAFNVNLPLDDAQLVDLGKGLFVVLGLFNAHATVASTDKIGLPAQQGDANVSGPSDPVPAVPERPRESQEGVQPVRRAANGDILDGLDTTYTGG